MLVSQHIINFPQASALRIIMKFISQLTTIEQISIWLSIYRVFKEIYEF